MQIARLTASIRRAAKSRKATLTLEAKRRKEEVRLAKAQALVQKRAVRARKAAAMAQVVAESAKKERAKALARREAAVTAESAKISAENAAADARAAHFAKAAQEAAMNARNAAKRVARHMASKGVATGRNFGRRVPGMWAQAMRAEMRKLAAKQRWRRPRTSKSTPVRPGMVITLQGDGDKFCTAAGCADKSPTQLGRFLVIDAGRGYIALKGGKHRCVHNGKYVACAKEHIKEGRKLKLVYVARDRIALAKANGKYCSAGPSIGCSQPKSKASNFKWKCIKSCGGEELDSAKQFSGQVESLMQLDEVEGGDRGWLQ